MHAFCRSMLLVALVLCGVACGAKQTKSDAESVACETAPEVLRAELAEGYTAEVIAEFGVVEARSVVDMPIRVKNTTNEPIVLLDYSTTCRCTTLALPRTAIEAGGECEVVLTLTRVASGVAWVTSLRLRPQIPSVALWCGWLLWWSSRSDQEFGKEERIFW